MTTGEPSGPRASRQVADQASADPRQRLHRFRTAHPEVDIIQSGPWHATFREPDGERFIVRWDLADLLDQLDHRLAAASGE